MPTEEFPVVYGILMDWPVGDHTATVVALCDGNASIYTTSTFGVIGGVGHEAVCRQAKLFVKLAAQYVEVAKPTTEHSYPKPDQVRFYLLTFDGVRVIELHMRAVENDGKFGQLFAQGQMVVTELRLIVQKDQDAVEQPKRAPEWFGAKGYVNCLLTSMSEGALGPIELVASQPVPNLVELTAARADLTQWIQAQQFQFDMINTREVIQVVRNSASATGLPFLERRGQLPTIHAVPDGKAIARVFDITVGPFDRFAKITLASDSDPRVLALQRQTDAKNS